MRVELGIRVVGIPLATLAMALGCNNSPSQSAPAAPSGGQQASAATQPTPVAAQLAPAAQPVATAPAAAGVAGLSGSASGSAVDVTAKFFGWKGPCRGDPPTRSAWQLADDAAAGSACAYVDGPMPGGLNPAGDTGMTVRVRGTLETYGGATIIKAQSAEVVP